MPRACACAYADKRVAYANPSWSDKISRLFDKDPLSKKLGFSTKPLPKDMSWWSEDWMEIWKKGSYMTVEAALE